MENIFIALYVLIVLAPLGTFALWAFWRGKNEP
jgi:hypothetical protein